MSETYTITQVERSKWTVQRESDGQYLTSTWGWQSRSYYFQTRAAARKAKDAIVPVRKGRGKARKQPKALPEPLMTDITVILDCSASMHDIAASTQSGFNEFLTGQKKAEGFARMTLIRFAGPETYSADYAGVDVEDVYPLSGYDPSGRSTAMLDAIGRTLNNTSVLPRDKTLIVIITDGLENSSRQYNREQIRRLIEAKRALGWEFLFLGANQDAVLTGEGLGISKSNSLTYAANAVGTQSAYRSVTNQAAIFRAGGMLGFSADDRSKSIGT